MPPPPEVVEEFEAELDAFVEAWVADIEAHAAELEDEPEDE